MDVKIALTGFGNVGKGLATLLAQYGSDHEERYGVRLLLTGVTDRAGAAVARDGLDPARLLRVKESGGTVARYPGGEEGLEGEAFLDAAGAQILVEAASTNFENAEPGWGYVRGALARGMDVVLASKGSLALYWDELMGRAAAADRQVLFSATVGSPLPSLQIADRALVGTRILGFEGIVNGTSHQILSSMAEGATYEEGVKKAQEIGIAETDPTLDVDGWDAAAKTLILANAVLGARLSLDDVAREGIRGVTVEDLRAARADGQSIKLIARAMRDGNTVRASVAPERRPLGEALGRLTGDHMGMVFHTEPLGLITTTAEPEHGGGGITTAMTVLRDLLNLSRDRGWATPR